MCVEALYCDLLNIAEMSLHFQSIFPEFFGYPSSIWKGFTPFIYLLSGLRHGVFINQMSKKGAEVERVELLDPKLLFPS